MAGDKATDDTKFDDIPQLKDLKNFVPPVRIAKVLKVYDGDTITVGARLLIEGKHNFYKFSVRIAAIDCPELQTKNPREKQVALEAKNFVRDRVLNLIVILTDISLEKYGRLLAHVSCNGDDLGAQLLDAHLAVPYDGGTKTVVEDWLIFRNQAKTIKHVWVPEPVTQNHNQKIFEDMPKLCELEKFVPPVHTAKVVKVYDGDSVTIGAPLHIAGECHCYKFKVRVRGIDCPDIGSKNPREKQVAIEAKSFVQDRALNRIVHLTDTSLDKYGRLLAHVRCRGNDLGTQLLAAHLAVPYGGGPKSKVEDWVVYRNQVKNN